MSHFVYCCPPLASHLFITLPSALALQKRGHKVAFYFGDHAGYPGPDIHALLASLKFPVCPARKGARFLPFTSYDDPVNEAALHAHFQESSLHVAQDLTIYLHQSKPDVLIIDCLAIGALMVMHRVTIPWATFSTSGLADSPMCSPFLHLLPIPKSFDMPNVKIAPQVHYVGMSVWKGVFEPLPPWIEQLTSQQRPLVLVGMTSLRVSGNDPTQYKRYLRAVLDGLAGEEVTLIVALSDGSDPAEHAPWPANARFTKFIPYAALMPRVSAMISNAGLGTLTCAISNGVPIVAVPICRDQPMQAQRCQNAGIGIQIPLEDLSAERVRSAVREILDQPLYRTHTLALAEENQRLDPPEHTADLLEQLASTRKPIHQPDQRVTSA